MGGNPDDYRFLPGEIVRHYEWTPDEVLAAKTFILEQDPPLWDELKRLEQDRGVETFAGTDEGIRSHRLLFRLHPDWDGRQVAYLWGRLRVLWRSEIEAGKG